MQKAILAVLCVPLVLLLTGLGILFFYYPAYRKDKTVLDARALPDTPEITAVSANVRCWSPTDLLKKSWFYRAPLIMKTLLASQPDIIGFQEVTPLHLRYLVRRLPGYEHVICYRDDSFLSEGCPVFYNAERFSAAEQGSFWLSETPGVSSKDWGAAFPRVCSYVILEQKSDGRRLVVFNTHLDHVSDEARIRGMRVILERLRAFGDLPCVVMGDLNAGEGSSTYAAVTTDFLDAKYRTEDTDAGATYQNWGQSLDRENIDYFMVSKSGIAVSQYRVLRDTYDGVYPSDHFPIRLRFTLTD